MAIGIEYQPPTALIDAYSQQLRDTPKLLTVAYKRATSRLRSRWIGALDDEPPPAQNYTPLPYKSPKQRRKVHAIRQARGGGAYVRTHKLSKGWKIDIEPIADGGEMILRNPAPEAEFVYGDFDTPRQPMFVVIPWLNPWDVSVPFMDEAEVILAQTLNTISSPTAGVAA